MKREIQVWDYAGTILQALEKGVLLTTKADDKVNTMTIGWGKLGVVWSKPVFIAYVRESRHTKAMLDKTLAFTVNVPVDGCDKRILSVCGTKSGRDMDKIQELGLTLEEPLVIDVPAIRELPLTLECKVIYRQDQDPEAISREVTDRYYPKNQQFPEGDYHTAYFGQIVAAYIVE